MSSNLDDLESWPLGDDMFAERADGGSESNNKADAAAWFFSPEQSPEPSSCLLAAGMRQDSDIGADVFAKGSSSSSWTCRTDHAAAIQSLEQLMKFDRQSSSSGSEGSSTSTTSLGKRPINAAAYSSSSKLSSPPFRTQKSDEFHLTASSSKSLGGSFCSTVSSSLQSSNETTQSSRNSVSPPLPRNLSLLSDEHRAMLQGIVANRRHFLSNSRKSNLEKLYLQACPEEELLLHVIRTYITKIPRNHSRLQLDQATQALRHFIEMQLCIPFENFLITDPKLPGHPIVHATSGFQRLTGYTRQESLGRNCNFIQGPSTLTDTIQQFSFLLASAQCGMFEILNYRKDGTPFWNLVYVEPICDQFGLVDKFFGVQVDISDVLDRHQDRSKSRHFDERGVEIGPIRHSGAKASADVALLEDGSIKTNTRNLRPFLGDRHVIELVQRAVHSGTPSMIETRFPNRSGPSMLIVRSSPAVKNFVEALQCDALTSQESCAPLPKEQRDMKVVQFLYRRLSLQFKKRVRYDSRQRVASSRLRVKGRFVPLSEMASAINADIAVGDK